MGREYNEFDIVFLYEIEFYNIETSSTDTLRFANKGYITHPSDTPANTAYDDDIQAAGSFSSFMFGQNRTTGEASVGLGELVIDNSDGEYDYLLGCGFSLRTMYIKKLYGTDRPYSEAETIFTGTIEQAEFSVDKISFVVKDLLDLLDVPAQTVSFDGTNADADDVDGDPEIEGVTKPFVYGSPKNITPVLVNQASIIYACNFDTDGDPVALDAIDTVYDGQAEVSLDTSIGTSGDFSTVADLATATITAGKYATCLAAGMFRLEFTPTYDVTCDPVEGATSADRTAAQIIQRLVTDRTDLTSGDFTTGTITAFDTAIGYEHELFIDDDTTILEACNRILSGLDAAIVATIDGKFSLVKLDDPAVSADLEIEEDEIYETGFELTDRADDGFGLPFWKVKINHTHNYTVLSESQVAGAAVTNGRVEFSKLEYRFKESEDTSIQTIYKAAEVYELDTNLISASDAASLASDILTYRKQFLAMWRVPTTLGDILNHGSTVEITYDRFGMNSGWKGVIVGYEYSFETNEVTYVLLGKLN